MKLNAADPEALKRIVSETLGNRASKMLVSRMHSMLDEGHGDHDALRQTCQQIERMVGLFHGPETARVMNQRFQESLLKNSSS